MDLMNEAIRDVEQTKMADSSSPGQNGRQFADNFFKCIFMNEKFCISIWILLKFVSKGPINNKSKHCFR